MMSESNKRHSDAETVTGSNGRTHFDKVSHGYSKAAKIIFISMAALFLVTLFFNSKLITYNNFSYLMRDISSAADIASENYSSISYKNDEMRVTKGFRGGIITVSSTDLTIYNATGRRTLSINENLVSPNIAVSKKYAVVYELGGNKYRVYNSFARISAGSYDYPISGAAVSDSGWFALVTKDNEHNSVVHLYDDDCHLRNTYSFASKYVFSVAINEKGSRIAIVLTEPDGDKFSTSVMICDPGKNEKRSEVKVSSGLSYGCAFTESNNIQLVCSDGVFIVNGNDGAIINSCEFFDRKINRVSLTSRGVAVSFSGHQEKNGNEILVFDKNGNQVYNNIVSGGIIDMEYSDGYLFINQSTSIERINIKKDERKSYKITEDGTDIIIYDSSNILVCCPTKAMYVRM